MCIRDRGGCDRAAKPPAKQANTQQVIEKITPDNPESIAALEAIDFQLKKSTLKDGTQGVTELSISADSDISESMHHLAGLPNVRIAKFTGTGLDDKGMEAIESLQKLERLDLSESRVTDKTLESVVKLPNLQVLQLRRVAISDEAL